MTIQLDQLPPVLTAADLAEIFRVSKETIRRKTAEGYFVRVQGFHDLRYRRDDILKLLSVQPAADPEDGGDGRPPSP